MNPLKIAQSVKRGDAYFTDPGIHHLDRLIDWNNRFTSSHEDFMGKKDIEKILFFISTHIFQQALPENIPLHLNTHSFIDFPYNIEVRLDENHPNVINKERRLENSVFDRLFTTWHRPVIKPSRFSTPGLCFVLNLDHNCLQAYHSSKNKDPRSFDSFYFHYYLDTLHARDGLYYCLNLGSITSIDRLESDLMNAFLCDKQELVRFLESKGFVVRDAPPYSIYPSSLPSPRIML